MAATNLYKGNNIGTSKQEGLFKKLSDEGTELKLLEYQDFLPGIDRAPFVTHDINTGEPTERDSWWKLYVNTSELAVQRRLEDVKRITKFIASPKGILWESERAALETIQKDLQQQTANSISKVQTGGSRHQKAVNSNTVQKYSYVVESEWSWERLGKTFVNLGKSVLQGIGLTAATLEQTGVSGTGTHVTTYISRAYLNDWDRSDDSDSRSVGVLNQLLSYAGVTDGGKLNGAAGAKQGKNILGDEPWRKLDVDKSLVDLRDTGSFEIGVGKGEQYYESSSAFPLKGAGSYYYREKDKNKQNLSSQEVLDQYLKDQILKSNNKSFNSKITTGSGAPNRVLTAVSTSVREKDEKAIKESNTYGTLVNPRGSYSGEGVARAKNIEEVSSISFFEGTADTSYTIPKKSSRENRTAGKVGNLTYFTRNVEGGLYSTASVKSLEYDPEKISKELGLIPFCIMSITPEHRTYMNFPAYLDSYDDNYTGEWESVKYVGRAENFYGYKGFTRSINLAFKVIAFNEDQLVPLYRELNRLVGVTAPSYKDSLFMRGTLASITVGDLLRDKLGIIPSVKLSWAVDDPWEIVSDGQQTRMIQVPHVLSVSLQFTPIEKDEVREDLGSYFVFDPSPREFNSAPGSTYTKIDAPEVQPPVEEVSRGQESKFARDMTAVGSNSIGAAGGKQGYGPADIRANDQWSEKSKVGEVGQAEKDMYENLFTKIEY